MANHLRPRQRKDFEIAVICALRVEVDAVEALFDAFWEENETYGKAIGDPNAYITGRLGNHNVVLVNLPGMGIASSSSVAASLRSSFTGIKLGLVVGICGGVPFGIDDEKEILLGDVIISTGIIPFDTGRQFPNAMVRKDTLQENLGRPNTEIRSCLAQMARRRGRKQLKDRTAEYLKDLLEKEGFEGSKYPSANEDILYPSTYRHKHQDKAACTICAKCESKEDAVCVPALSASCLELQCDQTKQVPRERLKKAKQVAASGSANELENAFTPTVHFGLIASGGQVMKSGHHRDDTAKKEKVIAFEMEGSGAWDNFPTVVIKGVCDYADSHKNKIWQQYASATAAACMKAFLNEWRVADVPLQPRAEINEMGHMDTISAYAMSISKSADSAPRAPLKLLPRGRRVSEQYVDRVYITKEIETCCLPTTEACREQPTLFLLHGLGGSGKTQACLRFFYSHKEKFYHKFWIDASTRKSIEEGYGEIAREAGLPEQNLVGSVVDWLAVQDEPWLLVLDDVDSEDKNLFTYFPAQGNGCVFMTSRSCDWEVQRAAKCCSVNQMGVEESTQLLLKIMERGIDDAERIAAKDLVNALGNLALAIDLAGTHIRKCKKRIQEYLCLFNGYDFAMQGRNDFMGYGKSVHKAFQISYDRLANSEDMDSQHAVELLHFFAFLHSQNVSAHILYEAWTSLSTTEARDSMNEGLRDHQFKVLAGGRYKGWRDIGDAIKSALHILESYSILSFESGEAPSYLGSVSMHPLVYRWIHFRLEESERQKWWNKAACTLAMSMWKPLHEALAYRRSLVPHLDRLIKLDPKRIFYPPFLSWQTDTDVASRFADTYSVTGYFHQARDIRLEICESLAQRLPASALCLIDSLRVLAHSCSDIGEHEKALEYRKQVLTLVEPLVEGRQISSKQLLGWQSDVADSYQNVGQHAEAYELRKVVSKGWKEHLSDGISQRECLRARRKEANSLGDLKRHPEALHMLENVVREDEKLSASDDHELLISKSDLGHSYSMNGYEYRALQQFEHVLQAREHRDPNHPDTIVAKQDVANTYSRLKRKDEAYSLRKAIVQDWQDLEARFPPAHPNLFTARYNLAHSLFDMGEMERSCQIHREVLELRRIWLGRGHHDTVASMASVAFTLKHLGRKKDSLNMRSDIVKVWEEKLQDSTHPQEYRRQWLKARNDLANSHVTSGSIDEAIALRLAVLQSQQEFLGNEHADTIQTMSDQARDYAAKGDYESAVLRCEETLRLQQSCLENHHPQIRSSMKRLAKYYHKLRRERQVMEMYESLYKIQLAAIGEDSEDTLKTAKRLKKLKLTTDETPNKDPAIP